MELSAFAPKDTVELAILDPRDGKPTDVTFTLAGPAHPVRQAATRALLDGMGAAEGEAETPPEKLRDLNTDYLAACVLGWQGLTRDSQALPHSLDEAKALLGDPRFVMIRSQVDRAMGDNRRFFD